MFQPQSSLLTVKYYPNGDTLTENPPRFTFMPAGEDGIKYTIEISTNKDFEGEIIVRENLEYNFYTLDARLEPGQYFWRYYANGQNGVSETRAFTVPPDLPGVVIPTGHAKFESCSASHPRLWLNSDQIEDFRSKLKKDYSYCHFDEFYELSVKPQLEHGFPSEPPTYPNHTRVREIWRANYMTCQQAVNYIRSLSIAGIILEDEALITKAKSALLEIIRWDVDGSTSRDYNDECSFRVCYATAFGFDWLYNHLSTAEREEITSVLYLRTKQVTDHVIKDSRIHYSLYDSHAVRSLSSVLVPACIAMLSHENDAADWLSYTIDYFSAIYTPWGGGDGGWAEGAMYWTTGMAFLTDALNLLKAYLGINFYKRPFFEKTGNFIFNCYPQDTWRASFCDQSNLGERPGIKTAFLIRQFGAENQNPEYIWYCNRIIERSELAPDDFFNKGWWDLLYDNMTYSHSYGNLEEKLPSNSSQLALFESIGWAAINKNIADPANHIMLLTKSSPYGSVSHSHGDQNSFLIFAFGEPLIIESGYYIGFGSSMHLDYRRQTKSHNAILIDGIGQYAGMDKAKQLAAKGKIQEAGLKDGNFYILEDATAAYLENIDYLENYTREIYFIDEEYFIIIDSVKLSKQGSVDFLLHSLSDFEISANTFKLSGKNADLTGNIIYSSAGIDRITKCEDFDGVSKVETDGLENQFHLKASTALAKNHKIVTLLHPKKKTSEKYISFIKDDQGHDINIYINNESSNFTLILKGDNRY